MSRLLSKQCKSCIYKSNNCKYECFTFNGKCENYRKNKMKLYRKKDLQPMRPYIEGENMEGITINEKDTLEIGGMIAINKNDKNDMWYISKEYFENNYELVE